MVSRRSYRSEPVSAVHALLAQGAALGSQAKVSAAQELEARAVVEAIGGQYLRLIDPAPPV